MNKMSMANQYLSLSLFLMMLSFFIIMNGTASFEDSKARPVMSSLSLAFSNSTLDKGQAPLEDFVPHTFKGEGETIERIQALFNASIPDVQAKKNRLGNMLRIRLPVRSFELGIAQGEANQNSSYTGEKGKFLPMLVALLQKQDTSVPYRMDMILAVPDDPAAIAVTNAALLAEKTQSISTLARTLVLSGIPSGLIGVGLERGENGFLDIYFRRLESYEPPPAQEQTEASP